jgi:ribonuclease HI
MADAQAFVDGKDVVDRTKPEKFYAIAIGRNPGVYTDWGKASEAITGWKGPKYKGFGTRAEAVEYIRAHGDAAGQASIADELLEPVAKRSKTSAVDTEPEPGFQNIYTDGSSLANGRAGAAAGVGVYFGPGDPRQVNTNIDIICVRHCNPLLTKIVKERLRAAAGRTADQSTRRVDSHPPSCSEGCGRSRYPHLQ